MKVQSLIFVATFFYLACTQLVNGQLHKDCQTSCGNVKIEYPFGTSPGCYYADDPSFNLTCNEKEKLLFEGDIEVINISHKELRVWNNVSFACYDREGNESGEPSSIYTLGNLSLSRNNKLTLVGCNALSLLITFGIKRNHSSGCMSSCDSPPPANGDCNGEGCCMTDASVSLDSYAFLTAPSRYDSKPSLYDFNPCTYAFIAEIGSFHFDALEDLWNLRNVSQFPMVLDWSIGEQTCNEVGNTSICVLM